MLSTLVCSKCGDPVAVSSRSAVLPFVCEDCIKAPELLAAMAPTPDACDSASVENTTRVIDDLQEQLQAERQTIINLEATKADLEGQLQQAQDDVKTVILGNDIKAGVVRELTAKLDEAEMQLIEAKDNFAALVVSSSITVAGLAQQNENLGRINFNRGRGITVLVGRNFELQAEVAKLKSELASSEEFEERNYKTIDRLLQEKDELEYDRNRLLAGLQNLLGEKEMWRRRAIIGRNLVKMLYARLRGF